MRRHLTWFTVPLWLAVLSLGSACSSGDDGEASPTPEPPVARVLFLHDVSDLGSIQVDLDAEYLITVEPAELTAPVKVDPGDHVVAIRNPGAQQTLYEETITFAAQTYLIGLTGESVGGTLEYWKVDQQPPELEAGSAAVEVVSLYEGMTLFDVYLGDTLVANEVATQTVSEFVVLESGATTLKIFNAGSDPTTDLPVVSKQLELADESATMFLLQNQDGTVGIDTVSVL